MKGVSSAPYANSARVRRYHQNEIETLDELATTEYIKELTFSAFEVGVSHMQLNFVVVNVQPRQY
jgi:hypothetical protein